MADIRAAFAARPPGFTLPGLLYRDAGVFDLDLQHIWHQSWVFAGASCEIAAPGDFFTLTIGRTPIVVLRDRTGTVRAFFNTCRHRGSVVCTAERGRMSSMVCPYHQWTYDLTGRLRHADMMGDDFDPSNFSLRPVQVAELEGTIYVCLADAPPDFAPISAAIGPALAPHRLADAKIAAEMNVIEHANWKLVMENSRECYHCSHAHPALMQTFVVADAPDDRAASAELAAYAARCEAMGLRSDPRDGPDFTCMRMPFAKGAISITMDGKPAVARVLGDTPHSDIGSLRWVHYPSTFNHALGDYAFLFRMLPVGPQETLVTGKWLVHRDAVEGVDYDLETLTRVWRQTNDEDKILVERNQVGVNSMGYRPGPYAPSAEWGVQRFTDWYCATMDAALK